MSKPRLTVPGVYLVTRRCVFGQYLLHPYNDGRLTHIGKRLRNHCGYLLAHYSQKHGIDVGAACCLSSHTHRVVFDRYANLPDFERDHNAMLARFIRYIRKTSGPVWAPGSYNKVELTSNGAILKSLAYVKMQVVKDGLLDKAHHWDGFATSPDRPLQAETFYKDKGFWRTAKEGGQMPAEVTLQPKTMPGLAEELGATYAQAVTDRCYELAREARRSAERPVLGRRALKRIDWSTMPPVKRRQRKQRILTHADGSETVDDLQHIKPRFTYRNLTERALHAQRYRRFEHLHRERRLAHLDGDIASPWPHGTFWMCRRLGAPQASPD